jgi:lysophospholipase L1-like esterase
MGSSTAAGQGATPGQSWADRLQAGQLARQVVVHNIARNGALTSQALPAASTPLAGRPAPDPAINIDRALGYSPKLVLMSFPTNDTVAGYPADETVANLRTLRVTAAAGGAASIVLGVQPRDGLDAAQRGVLAEIDRGLAELAGACFVPLQAALADVGGGIALAYAAGDGVHLNDAGHALVQQRVQAVLDAGRCVRLAPP